MRRPESMSDSELLGACRAPLWRSWRTGAPAFGLALALSAVAPVAGTVANLAILAVGGAQELRRRHCLRELRRRLPARRDHFWRRYSKPAFEAQMALATAELGEPDGPDWVVVLEAVALPIGGLCVARVSLHAGPSPRGKITYRWYAWGLSAHDYTAEDLVSGDLVECNAPLGAAECSRLLAVCEQTPIPLAPSTLAGLDGMPCRIGVLGRTLAQPAVAKCNLFNLGEPHGTLTEAVWDLTQVHLRKAGA